ncbi:hypothetical protein EVAR_38109_1 [Eumeta japonica]|uniref:Uncharacterized protein n=1 Tax=Eumeta variegata TaxID=151549 RepID=A0A4C1X4J3_EUMVA|nr:hypothetical protein EVAR_38109_1 [Eumeta japonica]
MNQQCIDDVTERDINNLTRDSFDSVQLNSFGFRRSLLAMKHHARRLFIYNWFTEFKCGRVNLSDEFRDGRPSTAVNNKNIDAVRCMIETDRHVTYLEI